MNKTLPTLLLMILWLAGQVLAQTTPAAGPTGVAITPASLEAQIKPGSTYTQTFTIKNSTNSALRLHVSLNDVGYDANNNRINAQAGTLDRSASNWMNIGGEPVTIAPQSTRTVDMVITVPASATGSYATAPVFELLPESGVASTSVANIGIKFRALVLLTTDGGNEYNVELRSAAVTPATATTPLMLSTTLKNRGNSLSHVHGEFAILDAAGRLAGRGQVAAKRLIPGQTADISSEWLGRLPAGAYSCVLTVTYDRGKLSPTSISREIEFVVK